jgi:hypothetical protein
LISFKVAAGNVFIDTAIERAQIYQTLFLGSASEQSHASKESTDSQQQSHSLFLMSHVTANVSDTSIVIHFRSAEAIAFYCTSNTLITQNFPDSAFKPPKVIV